MAVSHGGTKTWRRLYKRNLPGFPRDVREKGQCRTLLCCQLGGNTVTRCASKGTSLWLLSVTPKVHPTHLLPRLCSSAEMLGKGIKTEQVQHTLTAACFFHTPSQMLAFSFCLKSHAGPFLWIWILLEPINNLEFQKILHKAVWHFNPLSAQQCLF